MYVSLLPKNNELLLLIHHLWDGCALPPGQQRQDTIVLRHTRSEDVVAGIRLARGGMRFGLPADGLWLHTLRGRCGLGSFGRGCQPGFDGRHGGLRGVKEAPQRRSHHPKPRIARGEPEK